MNVNKGILRSLNVNEGKLRYMNVNEGEDSEASFSDYIPPYSLCECVNQGWYSYPSGA